MTIRHLKIFIQVAETGKMSTAAKNCYLSQPTVSQAIHELEVYYGVPLFERLSRRLYITESGKKLLTYARDTVRSFELLEEAMRKDRMVDRLRIGASITVGNCLLSNIVSQLQARKPGLDLYTQVGNTREIQENLLNSTLDIALVEGMITHQDLVTVPVVDDFLVLACSPSHPFASRKTIYFQELNNQPFALRELGSGTRELFAHTLQNSGVQIKIACEANTPQAIRNMVMYDNYLTVISIRLIDEEVRTGKIHVIQNSTEDWNRNFFLVTHKNKTFTPAMELLRELSEQYKRPTLPEGISFGTLLPGAKTV